MSSNDVALKEPRSLDEFAGWSDEAESDGEQFSERSILGQRLRFSNEAQWLLPDKTELTRLLIVANVRRTVVKWSKSKSAPVTIFLKAGEKFPDLKTRNEETPKFEWIEDFDGKPKGPWEAQNIVYLVDPVSIDQYSYPTATIGGGIAVRELVDRIMWMRRLRGNAVYPIVRLATQFMRTKFKGRLRPHFEIVDWTKFDHDGGGAIPVSEPQQLPKPTEQLLQQPAAQPIEQPPAPATDQAEKMKAALRAIGAQTVEPPTLKEETGDEIKI